MTGKRRALVAAGLVVAAFLAAWLVRAPRADALRRSIELEYRATWLELDAASGTLAAALATQPAFDTDGSEDEASELFTPLRRGVEALDLEGVTALLFDASGEAVAWRGTGLLHEPDGWSLPESGRIWRRGVTAVTLMAVAPVGEHRLVVGRSFPRDPFPFAELARPVRWSLAYAEPSGIGGSGAGATWRISVPDGPDLVLAEEPTAISTARRWARLLPRPPVRYWLRLGLGALVLALLLAPGRFSRVAPEDETGDEVDRRLAVLALALALLGAAVHDHFFAGLACTLSALGVGMIAVGRSSIRGAGRLAAVALLAALIAAALGQTVERAHLRHRIAEEFLPSMAPPDLDELNDALEEIQAAFEGRDLASVLPPGEGPVDLGDLAFALWRTSPLPRRDALSALVAERPGEASTFSFGLALRGGVVPPSDPARWTVPQSAAWRDALVQGEATLSREGRPWGRVRYWYAPRPGFRLAGDELGELERNLVRGKPRHETADGLPPGVRYGLYDLDGRAVVSPWDEAPPLPATALDAEGSTRVSTPDGAGRVWTRVGLDGVEAIFLGVLGPREGLERVGFVAVFLAPFLLLPALVAAWSASGGRPWRAVRAAWRSYSRRLLLVYAGLLLVPLVTLNLLLLQSFAERERLEQIDAAREAMASARKFLVDYLEGLEPGFLFATVVDRELLEWISDLVGHQVNLYWGSQLFASSQQELFTAGILPRRIPGEIYDRLIHDGYDLGYRRQEVARERRVEVDEDLAYLEIYAPFDAEGATSGQQGLFVSVPLLEQEEEAERQLADLRRRALLVTTALGLLLLAVGDRLTRRFTRPIVELIDATRRIARGEPLPPLHPRDAELTSLTEAIGTMADQVAESRRGLLREKRFVERVVAHITSAVVSLDRDRRVAFQNEVATARLGTRLGESIDEALERDATLEPLRAFLAEAREADRPIARQIKLRPARDAASRRAGDFPGADDDETADVAEWSLTWVPIPTARDASSDSFVAADLTAADLTAADLTAADHTAAPAALLVVDDVTEVLRGQRLEAWAEMARIIAHEIKNPLTPIQLSTEHLVRVHQVDPGRVDEVLERCARTILANVAELRAIASEFSIYSRIPAAELEPGDLAATLGELAASYHAAEASRGVGLDFRADAPVPARFDPKLLTRAVRNLLENALRASEPSGGRIELVVEARDGRAVIEVVDSGPGVDPQKLERIFEPYFSTYDTGTGLGLAITRRIVEQHAGEIEARNRAGGGLAVTIRMPLAVPEPTVEPTL